MTAFADIVLLSFNATTAIVFQVILSIIFLKEVILWRFDLPALTLIICGSSCIILTANFADLTLTVQMMKDHLTSGKSIAFYIFTFILINTSFFILRRMLQQLAIFELDAEVFLNLKYGWPLQDLRDEEEMDCQSITKLSSGITVF